MINNIFKYFIRNHLIYKINQIKQHEYWIEEGSEPITEECKELTAYYAGYLSDKFNLIPKRIAPSVENAIYLKYVNKNVTMEIEVDNDLDAVGTVSMGSKILHNEEINGVDDLIGLVETYEDGWFGRYRRDS